MLPSSQSARAAAHRALEGRGGQARVEIRRPPWLRIRRRGHEGEGYAKLGEETKESVEEAMERYLGRRRELALGVLLPGARPLTRRLQRPLLE